MNTYIPGNAQRFLSLWLCLCKGSFQEESKFQESRRKPLQNDKIQNGDGNHQYKFYPGFRWPNYHWFICGLPVHEIARK